MLLMFLIDSIRLISLRAAFAIYLSVLRTTLISDDHPYFTTLRQVVSDPNMYREITGFITGTPAPVNNLPQHIMVHEASGKSLLIEWEVSK